MAISTPPKPLEYSPNPPSSTGVFPALAFSLLADQIYSVIEDHMYGTAQILSQYLGRDISTIRNTLTSMTRAGRLISLTGGGPAFVYALKIPSKREPNIPHALGCIVADLALSMGEEQGYGQVLPVSDTTKAELLKLPVKKRPDRLWRWVRPGETNGMEILREFQRTTLSKQRLREKLTPYFALDHNGKRILLETATKEDADKYLRDLQSFNVNHEWLKKVWVTCQEQFSADFPRYVTDPIWQNIQGKTFKLAKE